MTGRELHDIWHSKAGIKQFAFGGDWDKLPEWFQNAWDETADTLNMMEGFKYVHPPIPEVIGGGGIDVVVNAPARRKRFILF